MSTTLGRFSLLIDILLHLFFFSKCTLYHRNEVHYLLMVLSMTSLFLTKDCQFLEYWGREVLIACYFSRISLGIAHWGEEENLIQWIPEGNRSFPHPNTFKTQHDVKQTHISLSLSVSLFFFFSWLLLMAVIKNIR